MKNQIESRRKNINHYVVFLESKTVHHSGLKGYKVGDKFELKNPLNEIVECEVIKSVIIEWLDQEFLFVKEVNHG